MHVVIVGWDGAGTDLPGAERFRGLAPMYWRGAHAVVVGFDVTRMKGMASCDDWVAQLHGKDEPARVVVAVGNKSDLVDAREISTEEARAHFEAMNPSVRYFETSARTGEGVDELFEAVLVMVAESNPAALTVNANVNDKSEARAAHAPARRKKGNKCVIC